jgi:hypothetical protein
MFDALLMSQYSSHGRVCFDLKLMYFLFLFLFLFFLYKYFLSSLIIRVVALMFSRTGPMLHQRTLRTRKIHH